MSILVARFASLIGESVMSCPFAQLSCCTRAMPDLWMSLVAQCSSIRSGKRGAGLATGGNNPSLGFTVRFERGVGLSWIVDAAEGRMWAFHCSRAGVAWVVLGKVG